MEKERTSLILTPLVPINGTRFYTKFKKKSENVKHIKPCEDQLTTFQIGEFGNAKGILLRGMHYKSEIWETK